ncbi:MAG: chemotaxis protein CheW [Defluviitaleaceae bacterium]|jgi:purine-binding chemotaxis protein CheW|nr:chemotaxis protein CheW [Defluviitaleaceae bacterium]
MDTDLNMESRVDDTIKDQYLTFAIDNEDYGVGISNVKEIVGMDTITKVPEMPDFVEGIINLRGELIGVLDVRKRFNIPPKEYDEETCIIVIIADKVEEGLGKLGFIVDAVRETAIIPEDKISPPPNARLRSVNQFIRNIGRVGDEIKLLLDLEKFLAQD